MFMLFMVFASIGHFVLDVKHPENTPDTGKGMIVLASFFITCTWPPNPYMRTETNILTVFATTWGPMTWAIVAELYPAKYRAKCMALATASNWLFNFLLGFFTPFITGDIDFAYGYVFAGCLLVAALVVYFFVLEGKGRTLEELDWMYANKVKPWRSSRFKMPPMHAFNNELRDTKKEEDAVHAETA
jgi:MFS family permease